MAIRVGDIVFFRCNLHRDGEHSLQRGQRSIVVGAGPDDIYLCKYDDDDDAHARWVPGRWLEPEPGTFSLGFKKILERPRGLYSLGPLVSDLRFPEKHVAAYGRYEKHRLELTQSGFGFSFYDGINAREILGSTMGKFGNNYHSDLNKLGLIICEHPWLRGSGDRLKFLADLVGGFLNQLSTIPKILILRVSDWNSILESQPHLVRVRRIQVLDAQENEFMPHYTPLRHHWEVAEPNRIYANECAIIFHPITGDRFPFSLPLHVPECVLKEIFWGRKTLFLAAGTCESQIGCMQYFVEKFREHNMHLPGLPCRAAR